MDVFHCSTASHLPCWEGTCNLVFCVQFESQPRQILHGLTYKWLLDAFRSSSHLPSILKEVFESLQHQYTPILAVYCPLSHAERVPQIW